MFGLLRSFGAMSLAAGRAVLVAAPPTTTTAMLSSSRRGMASGLIEASRKIRLNTLQDNPGTRKQRMRVGRGPGTGKGKTSGRGHGGQKARTGNTKPRRGFEGGQTTIFKRIPKRGFSNSAFLKDYAPLNLGRLQHWINQERLPTDRVITMKHLVDSGCVTDVRDGVKLLGDGAELLTSKVQIEVSRASKSAIDRIEGLGGSITAMYYNRLGLRALIKPHKFVTLPKNARPVHMRDVEFYSNPANRGYLAKQQK